MKKKYLYLIGSILGLLVFMGLFEDNDPRNVFGVAVNIWVYRMAWLFITASFFIQYLTLNRMENRQ